MEIELNTSVLFIKKKLHKKADRFVYTRSALSLLEKLARCIECNEPVLLCGETGVGKTTALQHLARILGKNIHVINLNHQTETSDLLGSFKPIDIKIQMKLVKEKFLNTFVKCFSIDENQKFLNHIQNCFISSNWKYLVKLMLHAANTSYAKFTSEPAKLREWKELRSLLSKLEENLDTLLDKFAFQFFEGKLANAIQNGEWVILDEINLASSETLQFLSVLLEDTGSDSSSIILYEKGDQEPLKRHPDFRIFGAMNPANDIGKRNLPSNIRNR
jgi:midasin